MQPTGNQDKTSTISLILGISAIITAFTVIIGIVLGILAIIFGVKSAKQQKKGKSIAGIITGSFAVLLSLTMVLFWVVFLSVPALQRNSRDVARKNDVGMLVSRTNTFQANNRGILPTASELDITGLDQISALTDTGTPTTETAIYKAGVACDGTQLPDRAFSITVSLETGPEYCLGS